MLSRYLHLVGILSWAIDILRIDIFHETSMMSQYQVNPWIGQFEVIYHIFSYLNSHINMGCMGYDPMGPNVDLLVFNYNVD